MIGLGIDAGGSSSRWLLRDADGRQLGRGSTGPITGHVFTAGDLELNRSRLRALLAEACGIAPPNAVVAGITGYHPDSEASEVLIGTVCEALGLGPERVSLVNDMDIAYASAFAPGEGILLYAGTGSVAYHLTASGEALRAGGHGYLIDDAGAGFWIGRQGMKQTMRWLDRSQDPRGDSERFPLAAAIYAALGCSGWEQIVVEVYGGGRQRVAALAPAVAQAAELGDQAAAAILREAGEELARLANLVSARSGRTLPVAFAGGIAKLSPLLEESLRGRLPPGTRLNVVSLEPISAAASLAVALAAGGNR